jgi:hypothetical protein
MGTDAQRVSGRLAVGLSTSREQPEIAVFQLYRTCEKMFRLDTAKANI